ncbi:hypothetical protein AVEN_268465-1 [Araneus ventricosus]|uniref:Transposase Tc1-like domain-containing protein n=1 Tax=Araneus ventricosus TaxID=182803 RepID=A0A4Y2JUF0_ARAVE|nr:hypothetical protein AVEN_268465-1 [Araneus ventricosus]
MQILYENVIKYVSDHVCVGGASRETGLISAPYRNSCRIPDPSRESLGKVVQEPPRPTEDRYLSIIARSNRGATVSQLSRDLYAATGTRVTRVTVSKRLHETVLFTRRPAVCVPLNFTNRRVRLAWCREHRVWSMDQ